MARAGVAGSWRGVWAYCFELGGMDAARWVGGRLVLCCVFTSPRLWMQGWYERLRNQWFSHEVVRLWS